MLKSRISERFCRIKDKQVNLLEEGISEIGRQEVMKWRIKKCLAKDKSCEKVNCKYAPRGIGDVGDTDPFYND